MGSIDPKGPGFFGRFRSRIGPGVGLVKTFLRFEANVPVTRDAQGEIDWTETFKDVDRKITLKFLKLPGPLAKLEDLLDAGGMVKVSADGQIATITLPMWLADP